MKIELTAEWIVEECAQLEFCEDESVAFFDFYDLGLEYSLSLLSFEQLGIDCSNIYCWGYQTEDGSHETWERVFISMEELKTKCPVLHERAIEVRKMRIQQNNISKNPPELKKVKFNIKK